MEYERNIMESEHNIMEVTVNQESNSFDDSEEVIDVSDVIPENITDPSDIIEWVNEYERKK